MKKKKGQDRRKRWYDKGFWGVYKLNCPVCGTEFYTVNSNQPVCGQEKCRTKWENEHRETEKTRHEESLIAP